MKRFASLAGCLCAMAVLTVGAMAQSKPTTVEEMHKLHQDGKAYIALLEDPARDAYQKPHEVLMALALKEGERIADIGREFEQNGFRLAKEYAFLPYQYS